MSKHTPGPWAISGGRLDIRANANGARFIARAYCPETHELAPMDAECVANARLIAVSPEMLKALLEVAWLCDGRADIDANGNPNLAMKIQQAIEPVIAEATGEA